MRISRQRSSKFIAKMGAEGVYELLRRIDVDALGKNSVKG